MAPCAPRLYVGRRDPHGQQAPAAVHGNVALAPPHLLGRIVAALTLGRVALDRLGVDDRERWAGLAACPLAVQDDQVMVDLLHVAAVTEQAPVVVAQARRRQVPRHGVPRYAVAQDVADAVHDLMQRMTPRPPALLRDRQQRLQDRPFFVGEIAEISPLTTVILPSVLSHPNHLTARLLSYASRQLS